MVSFTVTSTYIVATSVVIMSVICEVEEFVAMVVRKLLVIVVEVTGNEIEATGTDADPGNER